MPLFTDTETIRINRLIPMGGNTDMAELQFFTAEIDKWKWSRKRKEQIIGDVYYEGFHDILTHKHITTGEDGKSQEADNSPNNRLVDNQFALMVDQKTNYLVGKPFSLTCGNKAYSEFLNKVFDKRFKRLLKYVCEDALKDGIGRLYPYYGDDGKLAFKHLPAYKIPPFWADDDHTILDCAIRLYPQEVWSDYIKEIVEWVEIFRSDGLYHHVYDGTTLTSNEQLGEHENCSSADDGEETVELNWERIPLIPFKHDKQEIPPIRRVKTLQDGINTMASGFENNMQEDTRNTVLILENCDDGNLGEFRHSLATFGAVKVRDDGGVEILTAEINTEDFNSILKLFKDKLIESVRGHNAKDDRMGNNPNQINIQSMYSDIGFDANGMEAELQAASDGPLWLINQDFANTGRGDFEEEETTIVFSRDMPVNESEAIENCGESAGILPNETIVTQHPWTMDMELGLEWIRKEKEEVMEQAQDYTGAFGNVQKEDPDGDEGGNE